MSTPVRTPHRFREQVRRRAGQDQRQVRAHDRDDDLKLFVLSFTAFFIAIYSFIA